MGPDRAATVIVDAHVLSVMQPFGRRRLEGGSTVVPLKFRPAATDIHRIARSRRDRIDL